MRYLTVIRHAKAVPGALGLTDFERPLAPRGQRQCRWLRERAADPAALGAFGPALVAVSPARRTRETFASALEGTPFVSALVLEPALYNGHHDVSVADVLETLRVLDDGVSSLALVGHNPTVYKFVVAVATTTPAALAKGRYPLAGAIVLALPDAGSLRGGPYDLVATFAPPD
ncbi:MAG: SixA phosphatase family protein [Acidimicrobiales bacterium]